MAESLYSKFKKYLLFQEDLIFITTLYYIFNEKHAVKDIKTNELKFIMSYATFKKYLDKLRNDARESCGVVCYHQNSNCKGHQVLQLMENYYEFLVNAVEGPGLFYKYVKFVKEKNDNDPMFGYVIYPTDEIDLGWKTWSQRLSYLKI